MARPRKTDASPREGGPSRLQAELASRILKLLHEQGAGPGYHLVELDLCRTFDVSRTPIRGALRLLADQGAVESRANRGFVLRQSVTEAPELETVNPQEEEEQQLFVAIARARNTGALPDQCTQQEMVRIFGAKLTTLVRVLRQLQELGLVERKAGNGWSFVRSIDSQRAQEDSYAFRRIIEPAALIEPSFELDRDWMEKSREKHLAFRKRRWRDTLAVEFYQMNSDFHEQLARCSGNQYLLGAVQRQNQLRSFLNYHWVHGVERVHESIEEHLAIMDALDVGDNAKARLLMLDHLTSSSRAYSPTQGESALPGVAA
jgi:DNA-binding GntR family transcriptional regulator